jgi:hypothetical protein
LDIGMTQFRREGLIILILEVITTYLRLINILHQSVTASGNQPVPQMQQQDHLPQLERYLLSHL